MVANFQPGTHVPGQHGLEYFKPAPVNRQFELNHAGLNVALEEANRLLGELNAYSALVPDVDFFIKMHIFKEATESCKIEGTKTELDDVLLKEGDVDPRKRDDWQEVDNYVKAMNCAIDDLATLPLSMRLLKKAHKILLRSVRGQGKHPGEMRTSQNWIGGSSLKDAFFIPPHKDELPELLSDLEMFWHNPKLQVPELIKVAISHYQFETIHPFLDGNGRLGRLLITLYLVDKNILSKPVLYLSSFLAKNRGAYYDALTLVRESGKLTHWLLFFLSGVRESANSGKQTFENSIQLRSECEAKVANLGQRAKNGYRLLEYLYSNPIVDVNGVSAHLESTHQAANSLIKKFVEIDILQELTGYKRNRIFSFYSYLAIFR